MNMITENHNHDTGYIALVNLDLDGLPSSVEVNSVTLHKKSEHHISLLCVKRIAPMIDNNNVEQVTEELVARFKKFERDHDLVTFAHLNEYRIVVRGDRMTLVEMVDIPELKKFFTYLEQIYGMEFPLQPAHITLYTKQPDVGIGLLSEEEVRAESESVAAEVVGFTL